jgi:hypothetical protein
VARHRGPTQPILKNPLRTPAIGVLTTGTFPASGADPGQVPSTPEVSAPQLRKMEISEFSEWLRTQTNKNKLPFQE